MHWDGYGDEHKSMGSSGIYVQPDEDGFFTSGLLWLPGQLVWYANGREVARWEDPRVCSVQMDIMFTMPMGGWDNSPLDETQLPDDFVIDYVRVWQRRDLLEE
jgi:beta-glucanase (GH16 family)